jgi:tetratricopeptide (TPR) repeat protein
MFAVLILIACSSNPAESPDAGAPDAATAPAPRPPGPAAVPLQGPSSTYAEVMARIDEEIRDAERLALKHANDWARWSRVADLWAHRARQSGDYADYGRAEDAFAVAFQIAPEGSGPLMSRAALNFALHRLDRVEQDLAVVEGHRLDDNQRAALLQVRADLALQRGRLDDAAAGYRESLTLHDSFGARFGLAHVGWLRGGFDEAQARLDEIEEVHVHGPNAPVRMWLDLQRGLIELSRGRHEAALAHYRDADAEVAGHWLVREHVAEVTELLGRPDEALAMYEQIVLDTHNPEFMDAVAGILDARGDEAGAERWVVWADQGFARQLAQYPEAAAGHALDHVLAYGDPTEAVALAERNAALRPNGEALTQLARAYRQAGRLADADRAIRRAVETGWAWPDPYEEEAEVAGALGDESRAAAARAEVERLRES